MCGICSAINLKEQFWSPDDYVNCLNYIQRLLGRGEYELLEATCDLKQVRNEQGQWADDIIVHVIRCRGCGQVFTCACNTWRGSGSFRKGR